MCQVAHWDAQQTIILIKLLHLFLSCAIILACTSDAICLQLFGDSLLPSSHIPGLCNTICSSEKCYCPGEFLDCFYRLCEDFEEIAEKALSTPPNTEKLMELKVFEISAH